MVWRIAIDWLPDGDETRPKFVAHGRICHLDENHGADLRSFHAYFEVEPNPASTFDHPQSVHQLVGTTVVEDYPRFQGSIWDLVTTMLVHSGRGWPGRVA